MPDLNDLQPASADLAVDTAPADLKAVCGLAHGEKQRGRRPDARCNCSVMGHAHLRHVKVYLCSWALDESYLTFITRS
jgi:hypothetical protein